MRAAFTRCLVCTLIAIFAVAALPSRAADETVLKRVNGTVGYSDAPTGALIKIIGQQNIPSNDYAITQTSSQGILQLADSSLIGLGANTTVLVGALTRAANGAAGATIQVPTAQTAYLRFDIKHPAGQQSSYKFVTPTSSVATRGTVGLLSVTQNGDTITCIVCAANDVAVTVGTRTFPLLSGQTLVVTLAGVVTTVATSAAITSSFSSAGLSTSATAAAPVAGGAAAAGAAAGTSAAAAGAAVAAGAAAAAAASNTTTQSVAMPTPIATTTGTGTIQGKRR